MIASSAPHEQGGSLALATLSEELRTSFKSDHWVDLKKSGLSDETIKRSGVYSVRPADIGKVTAVPGVKSLLAFPYSPDFTRYKVFPTNLKAKTKSGKLRYLQPQGSGVHLYVPPGVEAVLSDVTVPLGIVEGEKKALKACQEGIPCVAIGGLWNWLQDGRLLPEIRDLSLKGRQVVLYPDSDVWKRTDLMEAVYRLGHALEGEGASLTVCALEPGPGETKQGLDDCLLNHSVDDLKAQPHIPLTHKRFAPTRKKLQARDNFGKPEERPLIRHAHEITEERMRWLWEPYIPLGMLVMLDGDPGLGKSMMLLQVAANLSQGRPFLDQTGKPTITPDVEGPQATLVLSAEDSLEHVMIPRLKRAGADLTQIKFLTGWLGRKDEERAFDLQHLPILVQAIEQIRPALVILDPLVAYLGDIDMHRANQTRPLMAKLKQVAERSTCTIIAVRHPSKLDQGGRLMYRGQGNIDIIGAARSALWVQQHPSHPETRSLMIHDKTNIGMPGRTVVFSRERGEFAWLGVSRMTEAMVTGRGPDPYALLEAFFWLEETMKAGTPYKAADLEKQAEERDISLKALKRAKKLLGITSIQRAGGWYWTLPVLSSSPPPPTKDTGDAVTTGTTGTTGYPGQKSDTYVSDPDLPCAPSNPSVPSGPSNNTRAREREDEHCPTCGQCDWHVTPQGERVCIPCGEREEGSDDPLLPDATSGGSLFVAMRQVAAHAKARIAELKASGHMPTHCRRCHQPLQEGEYVEQLEGDTLLAECRACNDLLGG